MGKEKPMKKLSLLLVMIFVFGLIANVFADEVTIGDGNETARVPVDMFWKNSLFQTLYFPDELGFASGTISGVKFYNNFTTNLPAKPVKIWLGETTQASLSAYIPSTQLTLVYDGTVDFPTGTNTIDITFQTPYTYTGGNLVLYVNRPMDSDYFSSSDYFQCQTIGSNRALMLKSDSTTYDPANPPASPSISGQFPKTTFVYTGELIAHDLGALSISGNTTPSAQSASPYTISIKNNGSSTESTYTVKLMQEGNVELASVAGPSIAPQEILTVSIPWTPTATGPTYLYGKVEMTGDEIATNNQTANLNVVVQQAGVVAVTVGNGGSTGRIPLDMYYKNSLFETVYLASELNIGGLITGIQFYNNFSTNLPAMPTNIWMAETTQTDLAGGWIPSTQMTQVFTGNVDYPNGQNPINITLTTPFVYGGGNLAVMVERPMDTDWHSSSDVFVTQTVGTNRSLNLYSDSVDFDPAAPTGGNLSGMFPKTTFFLIVDGMGTLNGTVYVAGAPLAGATVTVAGTALTYTTGADGTYSFPYIAEGAHQVTATKHGYTSVTHTVNIVEDQTTTQDFTIALLPQVTVTGRIVGSDNPTVGIADATITLSGYEPYEATTNASGQFTIANVFANQTYNYTALALGYAAASGQVVVAAANVNMGDVTVNEIAFPPHSLVATESANYQQVNLTWEAPVPGGTGEWIHYDSGENNDSIGTGGAADFDVAIRFPASALTDYAGMSLHALKVWPAQAGTFSLRVWTGGTPTAPGTMVVDQPFTPVLDTYNTVELDNPVQITGTEELWFGYRCNVTSGYPAGSDAGPAIDGFGNMMYFQGAWSTLLTIAPTLNYNWNIQGYVGFSAPDRGELIALSKDSVKLPALQDGPRATTIGSFRTESGNSSSLRSAQVYQGHSTSKPAAMDRALTGYKVYRLLAADQGNETAWTTLTANPITPTNYTDSAWGPLPSGVYKYAVKATYTNNVLSPAIFSAELHKGMMGTLEGTVTEFGTGIAIEGATITAGDYSGTTDANGDYSFAVYAGNYSVVASMGGYQPSVIDGVVIVGLQTTTLDFTLTEITLPPTAVNAEEAGANVNVTWTAPDPNAVDITEGFEGDTFPPEDWSQVITDTGPANTLGVLPTWCQMGEIALNPVVAPHGGDYQAAMWWSYSHQDEWLITPQFACPGNAALTFWSYVFFGSTNGDHYYVKISTDNGSTWTTLWDASTLTGGQNAYTTPIVVDLAAYAGQQIKLALNAEDPPSNDGMWYVWFVDDVVVGSPTQLIRFENATISRSSFEDQHPNRAFEGYKVWRLLQGQESNEAAWITLTDNAISATAFQDAGWGAVSDGIYKWAVKAIYTGGAMSNAAFSNPIEKATEVGTIAGFVRNMDNQVISGATVSVGTHTATTNASGAYSLMNIAQGTHSVTASHPNYSSVTQDGVVVVTGQTTTVNFQLPASLVLLEDGFESYADFSIAFDPWVLVDVDQSGTYGITDVSWLNIYDPQAFIIFNPSATTPAVPNAEAHAGDKFAAAFASTTPPNNDWMITPQLGGGGTLSFWAKSFTSDYGLERFKVGVSTGGTNPADFTIISGTNFVEAPVEWTEYEYSLEDYEDQNIRVGIQCVSSDAFIFMVDDVKITAPVSNGTQVAPFVTALKGNYPNPFNPETTIRYSVKDKSPVAIEVFNVKGQLVRNLVKDVKEAGEHSVVWNGTDNNGRAVSSGIYYFKMNAGKYSSTKKMIMMK